MCFNEVGPLIDLGEFSFIDSLCAYACKSYSRTLKKAIWHTRKSSESLSVTVIYVDFNTVLFEE